MSPRWRGRRKRAEGVLVTTAEDDVFDDQGLLVGGVLMPLVVSSPDTVRDLAAAGEGQDAQRAAWPQNADPAAVATPTR